MNDCPNCEAGRLVNGHCPRCDWRAPTVKPVDKPKPDWELPANLRDLEPLTLEQSAQLKHDLANLYAKFGVPVEKLRKVTLEGMMRRCPLCENGNFVHSGTPLDVHHCAKPRARYLTSFDHCVALCRPCHDLVEGTYKAGRLVITPLGQQRFDYQLVRGTSKFAVRALHAVQNY